MGIKQKISITLVFSALLLSSFPVMAVPTYNGQWTVHRHNVIGTSFQVLRGSATNFCYLSKVGVRETDTGSESATCRVRRSGSVWLLEAILGRTSDNDVFCSAICYTTR